MQYDCHFPRIGLLNFTRYAHQQILTMESNHNVLTMYWFIKSFFIKSTWFLPPIIPCVSAAYWLVDVQPSCCNQWLFELLLLFYGVRPVCPLSSDHWHHIFAQGNGYFSFLGILPLNTGDGYEWKSQWISSLWNIQTGPSGTYIHATFQSHFHPFSSPTLVPAFKLQQVVYTPKCTELHFNAVEQESGKWVYFLLFGRLSDSLQDDLFSVKSFCI